MNRRYFLKALAVSGMSAFAPSMLSMRSLYLPANAMVDYSGVTVNAPSVMPQVINIFLYGGPSELSGNMTNIREINLASQNPYTAGNGDGFGSTIIENDISGDGSMGQITRSGFWSDAGGREMQFMLDQGMMSVYRTINKVKDPTGSHRESILMSLKGSLDVDAGAGIGTRLASMMVNNRAAFEGTTALADGTPVTNLTDPVNMPLPFISFEGETRAFAPDPDFSLPFTLKYLTLDQDFDNPYTRDENGFGTQFDELVAKMNNPAYRARYNRVIEGFESRQTLEDIIGDLSPGSGVNLTQDTSGNTLPGIPVGAAFDADRAQNGGVDQIAYPDNNYTDRIRAAVTLAIENPSSMYITVGGGLGGWDDHNNGVDRYPARMRTLFETLRAAMLHIKYADKDINGPDSTMTPGGKMRRTDNIVINVFGDFGRRVNLNNSFGWDHGNNQNLFTFGGAGVRNDPAMMGKVFGLTELSGTPGTNNQVTVPQATSYQAEPMSIASSVYSYFGVQDPEKLTADEERNPNGDVPLREDLNAAPDMF